MIEMNYYLIKGRQDYATWRLRKWFEEVINHDSPLTSIVQITGQQALRQSSSKLLSII